MCEALTSLFVAEVLRLLFLENYAFMKLLQLFSHCNLAFHPKHFEYLFNNVLGKYGRICYDVGLWIGFNKVDDSIDNVGIGLIDIVEFMGTNYQVSPYHGSPIRYFVVVVDGGRIL